MNTLSLSTQHKSESFPRTGEGICLAMASSPATTRDRSLANRGTALVQPMQTSAATRLYTKAPSALPAIGHQVSLQTAWRRPVPMIAIMRSPGTHRNVATSLQVASRFAPAGHPSPHGFQQPVQVGRAGSQQSLPDLGVQCRWLCRSIDSTKWGNAAFKRLPPIQSDASHTRITAALTASS